MVSSKYYFALNMFSIISEQSMESISWYIAGEVFDDDFMSCMDKKVKGLDDDLKLYSTLTAAIS